MNLLNGALDLTRTDAEVRTASPPAGEPASVARTPTDAPVPGSGDDVSATPQAQVVTLGLIGVGVLLAWLMKESKPAFSPKDGFVLFTGFFIAAQAIERVLELLPGGAGTKQAKANRAVIFAALGFVLAVLLAEYLGLYYVEAVGATKVNASLDVVITALAIGGGTKPLHDGIKRLEKAKETPPATT